MEAMEQALTTATANGFPVVVAIYLLVRMEKELRELTAAIERLRLCQHCKLKEGSESK